MQKLLPFLDDIFYALGAALVSTGVGLFDYRIGLITGGAFCIAGGVLYGRYLAVRGEG